MKYIIFAVIFSFNFLFLRAEAPLEQPVQGNTKIETMRIEFITKRLALTADEAKLFWPIYEQFRKELHQIKKKNKVSNSDDISSSDDVSDAEAEKMLNELVDFRQAQADLARKYIIEFKKAIPIRKILLLYKAEEDFKKHLIGMLKNPQSK